MNYSKLFFASFVLAVISFTCFCISSIICWSVGVSIELFTGLTISFISATLIFFTAFCFFGEKLKAELAFSRARKIIKNTRKTVLRLESVPYSYKKVA